jgi:outer membrane lipoprotein carrier protein
MKQSLLLIMLFSGTLVQAQTQTDKKADEILKSLSKKYKAYTSVQADFNYKIEHPEQKTNESHHGSLLSKGNKYKLLINNQEIICDGKIAWTYLKEANEVQVNEASTKSDAITPNNIFTMYETGFLFKLTEEKNEGTKLIETIELIPVDKNKKFFKAQLKINKTDMSLVSSKIFNKDGSHFTYSITKFTGNVPIADEQFNFNAASHPKVEVIDLR